MKGHTGSFQKVDVKDKEGKTNKDGEISARLKEGTGQDNLLPLQVLLRTRKEY
jgi:hypothetical protein